MLSLEPRSGKKYGYSGFVLWVYLGRVVFETIILIQDNYWNSWVLIPAFRLYLEVLDGSFDLAGNHVQTFDVTNLAGTIRSFTTDLHLHLIKY